MEERTHKKKQRKGSLQNWRYTLLVVIYFAAMIIAAALLIFLFLPEVDAIIQQLVLKDPDVLQKILYILFALLFALIGFCISAYVKAKEYKKRTKNRSRRYSSFSDERLYLERQINELNTKLVSNEARWADAFHLILTSQKAQVTQMGSGAISTEKFLKRFGIDISNVQIQKNLVFVLTPFNADYEHIYDVIGSTCKEIKLVALRGDEEDIPKDVLPNIINYIVKARIVVANLDGRNPNVFYELGIAQALNKPTILLSYRDAPVPSDFNNQYLIFYKNDDELRTRLSDACLKLLSTAE